ncbi:MAG: hypothetical protein PHY56_07725, partial [Candidatus Omnitrophica bacterium]|nr:hypothetical protein [Candidatus Omnitrophota bacterium]
KKDIDVVGDVIDGYKQFFAQSTSAQDIITRIKNLAKLVSELKKKDIYPTASLVSMALSSKQPLDKLIQSWEEETKRIHDQGIFNSDNPLHIELGYIMLQRLIRKKAEIKRTVTYQDYLKLVEHYKKDKLGLVVDSGNIATKERTELVYLAYEAMVLKEFIEGVMRRAKELGLPVVVVENLSYGRVALSSIRSDLEIQGVRIVSTKIGSTECHHNPFYIRGDLFEEKDIKYILEKRPIVIVVDGSSSVANPTRSLPHYPDAYQGYRNYFIAVSEALGVKDCASNFGVNQEFLAGIRREGNFQSLVRKMQAIHRPLQDMPSAYGIDFWYKGTRILHIREHKRSAGAERAPPSVDAKDIAQPTVIIAQTCLEDEAIPSWVKKEASQQGHDTGYYDDKDNFLRYHLYFNNSGPHYHRVFGIFARKAYEWLSEINPHKKEEKPLISIPARETKGFIFDLDGVLALLGQPIAPYLLIKLTTILGAQKPVAIITEEIEQNLKERAWALIPANLRQSLHLYSNGGTRGFGFDNQGNIVEFYRYKLSQEERQQVMTTITAVLKADEYEMILRDYKVKIRVRSKAIDRKRAIAEAIQAKLKEKGLSFTVTFQGKSHINIFKVDKVYAAGDFINRTGLKEENIIIIVDSARSFGPDRKLLTTFPKAVSINVGSLSPTINKENPSIIQPAINGLNATKEILRQAVSSPVENSADTVSIQQFKQAKDSFERSFFSAVAKDVRENIVVFGGAVRDWFFNNGQLGDNADIDIFLKVQFSAAEEKALAQEVYKEIFGKELEGQPQAGKNWYEYIFALGMEVIKERKTLAAFRKALEEAKKDELKYNGEVFAIKSGNGNGTDEANFANLLYFLYWNKRRQMALAKAKEEAARIAGGDAAKFTASMMDINGRLINLLGAIEDNGTIYVRDDNDSLFKAGTGALTVDRVGVSLGDGAVRSEE